MLSVKAAVEILTALPGVDMHDHFGSEAYRAHDRNFATVWRKDMSVNFRFSLEQQRNFLERDGEAFAEIDNAWGKQGWTTVVLEFIDRELFVEAAQAAWETSKTPNMFAHPKSGKRKAAKKKAVKKKSVKKPAKKKKQAKKR